MRVTKLKNGYRVSCSHSDYEMLKVAVGTLDPKALHGDAKAAHTRRSAGGLILRVDVDRSTETRTVPRGRPLGQLTPPAM